AFGKVAHDIGDLTAAAEEQQGNGYDNDPMPYAERAHNSITPKAWRGFRSYHGKKAPEPQCLWPQQAVRDHASPASLSLSPLPCVSGSTASSASSVSNSKVSLPPRVL